MNKFWKILPVLPVLAALVGCSSTTLEKVQSGQADLYCNFSDGERLVPREMVTDFYDDLGVWKFTNGQATACRLVNKE